MKGKYHGPGSIQWTNGAAYTGDWCNGVIEGFGEFYWPTANKQFLGHFHSNEIDGFGVMQWGDGRKFTGSWIGERKHGYGVYEKDDGSSISGTWVHNRQCGYGIYVSSGGSRKYGAWSNGKKIETLTEDKAKSLKQRDIDP